MNSIDELDKSNKIIDETSVTIVDSETAKPKEISKFPGSKKQNLPSTSDGNIKSSNDQQEMNTQPLFEQPIILEGKRSRKPTSRLELTDLSSPKKESPIPQGRGKLLADIPYVNFQIENAAHDELTRLRTFCFGRRASKSDVRKSLREFKGFEFDRESDEYKRHLNNLIKIRKDHLKSFEDILGLSSIGSSSEQAERILQFLIEPVDEGKPIPERRGSTRSSHIKKSTITENNKRLENGGDIDDDDDLFDIDDDEEEIESDEDYIGSDDDTNLTTNDDPDDFVYQPGKRAPKRKSTMKRSRSSTTNKRKRAKSKRVTRTKSKPIVDEKKTNDDQESSPIVQEKPNESKVESVASQNSPATIDVTSDEKLAESKTENH